MKKLKLKPFVKISVISFLSIILTILVGITNSNETKNVSKEDNFVYVNDYIFDTYYPVVNTEEKLIRPYSSNSVTINKNFYDREADEKQQQNSIIYYENIYMQNSGVDYKANEEFDILSILSGTVTNITEDALLGKTVEIRNTNEIIVMYQCLGNVMAKKGDTISQSQVIAKSGTCNLNKDIKQNLHIEIYKNGSVINPEKYYDKPVKDLGNN